MGFSPHSLHGSILKPTPFGCGAMQKPPKNPQDDKSVLNLFEEEKSSKKETLEKSEVFFYSS